MIWLKLIVLQCYESVTWHMNSYDYECGSNSVWRIFGCCWSESVSCFLFYCQAQTLCYLMHNFIFEESIGLW